MSQPVVRLPDATRHAQTLARAVTIGLRAWNLYPPEHPALALAIDRLVTSTADATAQGPLMLAVTPQTLLVDGIALESPDLTVAECARVLHDLDILQLSFVAPAGDEEIRSLLATLSVERAERRARGGPAAIWAERRHPSIRVEQIDYQELLEREDDRGPARRDVMWQSIVRSIIAGRRTFTELEERRLLDISREAWAIGELADDCRAAYRSADGSPLLTTQAAAVLAVFRHIGATVGVLEPDRADETMNNFALATSSLEPSLALEVLRVEDASDEKQPVMAALKRAFDDQQVALLLARALAKVGEPTNRLAQMLDTLAPDAVRRQRVLRLADTLLSERDFGASRPVKDIRASLQELLLKYDESPFVPADYRQSMDAAAERAGELAARDLPPELPDWLDTLGHESVRALSGQLLIDLLTLETGAERFGEITHDIALFAQDLLLAGAYREALRIVQALTVAQLRKPPSAPDAATLALTEIGGAQAMHETMAVLGDLSADDTAVVGNLCRAIGQAAVPAVIGGFTREDNRAHAQHAASILASIGTIAIPDIANGIEERPAWVQRELAQVLGSIGTPAAVPPLQALLRRGDERVLRAVVTSLSRIDDPAAARALHTVLRAVSGTARTAVVQSLISVRDPRVVPMLVRILEESEALGADFDLVLDSLDAIVSFKDDRAVRPITSLARQRRWLAWRRTRQLRVRAADALVRIGSEAATKALRALQQTGDWQLRRIARGAQAAAGRPA